MSDKPIAAILHCPHCGERHIDEGELIERPHHTHQCVGKKGCGRKWRVEPYCYGRPYVDLFEHVSTILEDARTKGEEGRYLGTWYRASRPERRVRLAALRDLFVELEKICVVDRFATLLANGPIEAIIQGDWDEAELAASFFEFEGEDADLRARYVPLWKPFVDAVRRHCARRKAQ